MLASVFGAVKSSCISFLYSWLNPLQMEKIKADWVARFILCHYESHRHPNIEGVKRRTDKAQEKSHSTPKSRMQNRQCVHQLM